MTAHNDAHQVKFNGGDPVCLDCNQRLVDLGLLEETPPRILDVIKLNDGTFQVVGFWEEP